MDIIKETMGIKPSMWIASHFIDTKNRLWQLKEILHNKDGEEMPVYECTDYSPELAKEIHETYGFKQKTK